MDIRENLIKIANKYNIKLSQEVTEKLNKFNELMIDYNNIHNITAITNENDIIFKHYLDSLLGLEIIEKYNKLLHNKQTSTPDNKIKDIELKNINCICNCCNNTKYAKYLEETNKIIDIGAGAGFPSIPLSIANKNLNIWAMDSVNKKTNFINSIKENLSIDNLHVINSRIEDLANSKIFRESFDIVISRAVASLPTLLEYSAPLTRNGGYIITYKGINYKNELNEAKNALKLLNCELIETVEFNIPEIESTRHILVFQKNGDISTKYPRKQNKPRINPL